MRAVLLLAADSKDAVDRLRLVEKDADAALCSSGLIRACTLEVTERSTPETCAAALARFPSKATLTSLHVAAAPDSAPMSALLVSELLEREDVRRALAQLRRLRFAGRLAPGPGETEVLEGVGRLLAQGGLEELALASNYGLHYTLAAILRGATRSISGLRDLNLTVSDREHPHPSVAGDFGAVVPSLLSGLKRLRLLGDRAPRQHAPEVQLLRSMACCRNLVVLEMEHVTLEMEDVELLTSSLPCIESLSILSIEDHGRPIPAQKLASRWRRLKLMYMPYPEVLVSLPLLDSTLLQVSRWSWYTLADVPRETLQHAISRLASTATEFEGCAAAPMLVLAWSFVPMADVAEFERSLECIAMLAPVCALVRGLRLVMWRTVEDAPQERERLDRCVRSALPQLGGSRVQDDFFGATWQA